MSGIDLSAAFAAYLVEARELVQELEQGLMQLEHGRADPDPELIHALFRAAHTIKGSAGIVGIESLTRFTHHVETLLDRVRDGEPLLDDATLSCLLGCCDHITRLLDLAEAGDLQGQSLAGEEAGLLARLQVPARVATAVVAAAPAPAATGTGFRVWAVFGTDSLRDGIDPASALLFLEEQAPLEPPVLLTGRIPSLESLDPEDCWIAVALRAPSGVPAQAHEALEFCGNDASLAVVPADTLSAEAHALLQPLRDRLGDEVLQPWRAAGLIAAAEWSPAVDPGPAASREPAGRAISEPAAGAVASVPAGAAVQRFVRVPADRLDQLNQQVGELVIAGATADVLARGMRHPRLQEALSQLGQLIDSIQASALQLRMVPIGESFNRFQRVVRDVSRDLGKSVALELDGADTELDKAMVERIGDPLMHLVRNAMDHGLETPAQRLAAGKPETGTLRLRAFHDAGSVVVEVSDDGRGLDTARILAKALERGVITSGEGLAEHDIHQLIFEPGFSTAEQVTSLSGRGVGMDVVKRSVEALRGAITLHAQRGQGTRVQLRLPLTLAVIEGFMVGVGSARFILPLDLVVECIELPAGHFGSDTPRYLDLRGEVLPFISLRDAFAVPGQLPERPSVVVVRSGETKAGVLVDQLLGEIQTVIKPMSRIFRHLRAVCGTSILGTGEIALILDVHQLIQRSVDDTRRAPPLPGPAATAA